MNEEMNTVVNEAAEPMMDFVEASANASGKGAGGFVAAGVGLVAAIALVVGGIKFGVDKYKEHQSKKELRQPEEIVEPTPEQLDEVTM